MVPSSSSAESSCPLRLAMVFLGGRAQCRRDGEGIGGDEASDSCPDSMPSS